MLSLDVTDTTEHSHAAILGQFDDEFRAWILVMLKDEIIIMEKLVDTDNYKMSQDVSIGKWHKKGF